MIRTRLLALALVAGLAAPALGQQVEVTADSFTIDEPNRAATFTGNVVVNRSGLTLWADRVVVSYGTGGVEDIQTFEASGTVRIRTEGQTATGSRAVFDPRSQQLTMTGNVQVENAAGKVSGPQLVVDLRNNSSVFTGGSGGRVTGVFTPQ